MTTTRIACLQTEPVLGAVTRNLANQEVACVEAVANGADLLVLPECSTTGWAFESPEQAQKVAEPVPDGAAFRQWSALCRDAGVHLVAGVAERDGDALFNTAVLIGPDGLIGKYRKAHTWALEKTFYEPGNLGVPVFDTPLGRIGMHICYDCWFPESFRLMAAQGADLICAPSNWVPVPTQRDDLPVMANLLCMTNAHANLVYVAAADRVGADGDQPFIGRSIIVDHAGWPIAGPASPDQPEIIYADVDLIGSRAERRGNPFNQPLRDRRLDVYDEMLGSGHSAGEY
ncbi:MAG: nitrilase family protein [Acidimicrobiales bacterium]|jgi:predicted amidohydrolase|nr:nitrilase family protein [Acidimicrobiales bacterium]